MSSSKEEQLRVRSLLLDTVSLLCKNGLTFKKQMKIQGLLGITLDEDDVFIVHINEAVGDVAETEKKSVGKTPEKSTPRKRSAASSPASRGPPDKRRSSSDIIVIGEDDRKQFNKRPVITNVRGGLPPNHPLTPQKPGLRANFGSPNRMPSIRVAGSPNQRGGFMMSPHRYSNRGRPPLNAPYRCNICGTSFTNQNVLNQHMVAIHNAQPAVQLRPVGPPIPAGLAVKRNLYQGQQAPVNVRRHRVENNSSAPIDLDASPPAPGGGHSALSNREQPQVAAEEENNSTIDAATGLPTGPSRKSSTEDIKKTDDDSKASSEAGEVKEESDRSEAGSRPHSNATKSPDHSDTEERPSKTDAKSGSDRESAQSGLSESEMTSRSPGEAKKDDVAPSPQAGKVVEPATTNLQSSAITIAPAPLTKMTDMTDRQAIDIFNALEDEIGQILTPKPPDKNIAAATEPTRTLGQISIILPPKRTGRPLPGPAMEIKPEGPFGSEMMGAGGQQMFETQNRPVIVRGQGIVSNKFMTPQVTVVPGPTAAPLSLPPPALPPPALPPPALPPPALPPSNVNVRFSSSGINHNFTNPFIQHQQSFPPHHGGSPHPYGGGGPGFNGGL